MMIQGTHWTPAMDNMLRELHGEGLKYRKIAIALNAEFDTTLTRNACIGRGHRLKLPVRASSTRREESKPKRKRGQDKTIPALLPTAPPIAPGRLTMLQLDRHTCRWPSGNQPPYTYCGDPVHEDTPFCRKHCELAYNRQRG